MNTHQHAAEGWMSTGHEISVRPPFAQLQVAHPREPHSKASLDGPTLSTCSKSCFQCSSLQVHLSCQSQQVQASSSSFCITHFLMSAPSLLLQYPMGHFAQLMTMHLEPWKWIQRIDGGLSSGPGGAQDCLQCQILC